jgi:two-component system, sensor histidine kinase RegB
MDEAIERSGFSRIYAPNGWMRLRTLILLRWMAIFGQLAAITVAWRFYGMSLPLGLCFMTVGASIIANLVSVSIYPESKRLSEGESLLMLWFDLAQLALLLFLTGGLTNPFALLILAPVTISASALALRTTVILGVTAISFVTLNAFYNIPLRFNDGTTFTVPALFGFGFWLSIVIGIVFLSLYSRRVTMEMRSMSDALLATQMALAREQKLTDLGGVVAAAAHELGTPLATIKLVSAELMDELSQTPQLFEDARLIRDQADRCRDILRSMGRAGKDDQHMRQASIEALLREAAEPHSSRGKRIHFDLQPDDKTDPRQPIVRRSPEIIHGLRNMIQNAVDFARENVWIDMRWNDQRIVVQIADDGEGYSSQVIGRIGDPFLRHRDSDHETGLRPEYEGMGLGLFIAKTLLERSGADLTFANGAEPFLGPADKPDRCGAIVTIRWPLMALVSDQSGALGENTPLVP